jgi:hypothetical protein
MLKETDKDGTIRYYNENGRYHREDGPAVELLNGSKFWLINGKYHREKGPTVEYSDGGKLWHINGVLHREDGPAVDCHPEIQYWLNGKKYDNVSSDEEWIKLVPKILLLG